MLQHIALTINHSEEIKNFYDEILLFNIRQKFTIDGEITMNLFSTESPIEVYIMGHQGIKFEIFISVKKEHKIFSHICLAYWKAENIYKKSKESGYKTLIKKNHDSVTYFIWDKSENMFEIKELQK